MSDRGKTLAGNTLLKIVGGDEPAELSSDSDTVEVPERFVVSYATALAAQAGSSRTDMDMDAMRNMASFWFAKSEQARHSLPLLKNVRLVR